MTHDIMSVIDDINRFISPLFLKSFQWGNIVIVCMQIDSTHLSEYDSPITYDSMEQSFTVDTS